MIRGKPLFDGLAVMEFNCSFIGEVVQLEAKAAFVQTMDVGDRKGGATHGFTTGTHWSPDTMKKLVELRTAMEQDLADTHFTKDAVTSTGGISEEIAGIGELLTDEDGHNQI